MHDELTIEGLVDKESVFVIIRKFPLDDALDG